MPNFVPYQPQTSLTGSKDSSIPPHILGDVESRHLSTVIVSDQLCRLFVGGLAHHVDEAILQDVFSIYGIVVSTSIVRNTSTGISRCFGFVQFDQPSAVNGLAGTSIDTVHGRWDIRRGRPTALVRSESLMATNNRLFLGGVPLATTRHHIQALALPFGQLLSIYMPASPRGATTYAFIVFANSEDTASFMQHEHRILGQIISVSKARTAQKRR